MKRVSEVYTQASGKGNARLDTLDMSDGDEEGPSHGGGRFTSRLRTMVERARASEAREAYHGWEGDDGQDDGAGEQQLSVTARGKRRADDDVDVDVDGMRASSRRRTATTHFGD